MKRFYTLVSTEKSAGGYGVLLDGRPVNTPLKNKIICGTQKLADRIVQEWAAQMDVIESQSMPLTQLLSTKIDRISNERSAMSALVMKYIDTDLICYRTPEPPELLAQQQGAWDTWLEWFAQKFGVALLETNDLVALKQPEEARRGVKKYVDALDDDHFTILQMLTGVGGSLVLALAFIDGALDADEMFKAINVEEQYYASLYKADKYGPDPAQEKKDEINKADLNAASLYLTLV